MTWQDLDITLDKQHNGDINSNIHIDAVMNSITNIFKTMQGSRRMVPSFAMPIFNLLFEQIDSITLSHLEDMMLNAIQTWEDRITIIKLIAEADEDNNQIIITLEFKLRNDTSDKIYNINETLVMQG